MNCRSCCAPTTSARIESGRHPRVSFGANAAMRVLVATTAGSGHFAPLVPFAAALRDAGHTV
jgi:hypothetical protein